MQKSTCFYLGALLLVAILLDWEKWNIGEATTVLLVGFIQVAVVILLIILFVWSSVLIIENFKKLKIYIVLPIIAMIFVFGSFTFLPLTDVGVKVNYAINQPSRERVVKLLNCGDLSQCDINEFSLPFMYRLTSHPGRILVESNEPYTNKNDKVLFYVHCGWGKSSAIIYSANDKMITDGDFGRIYTNVQRLKPHWYMALMEW